jgi:protein-S-isoprenylcysteine O-methyltransferase Ste14
VGDEPQRSAEAESKEERDRLYNLGALAQSYAPRGLGYLGVSKESRTRARSEWRTRPRRERAAIYAVVVAELACLGVIFWGVAKRDGVIVVAGAGAIVVAMLGTAVATIVSELRRAKAGRRIPKA